MEHVDAVAAMIPLDQPALFVDPLELVLRLHHADAAPRPADRGEVPGQLAEEQLARVGQPVQPDPRILGVDQGHHHLVHHLLHRRHQVEAAPR
jgi:hypothetical protein